MATTTWQGATDSDGCPCYWLNKYECECGASWEDEWSCACDDECPDCGADISPSVSEWQGPGDGPTPYTCPDCGHQGNDPDDIDMDAWASLQDPADTIGIPIGTCEACGAPVYAAGTFAKIDAARAMLGALNRSLEIITESAAADSVNVAQVRADIHDAIAQAEAAGIKPPTSTDTKAADTPQPARVWLVTHSDRFGVANWAFSTEAKADAWAEQLARKRISDHTGDPCTLTGAELWEAYEQEHMGDETIEQDHVDIDKAEA